MVVVEDVLGGIKRRTSGTDRSKPVIPYMFGNMNMRIEAAPTHRTLAMVLAVASVGCFMVGVCLFREPLFVLALMTPLLIFFAIIYVPYLLDHHGVVYEVNDHGIALIRRGKVRRIIPWTDILSVRNSRGAILLRRNGFFRSSECLHPKQSAEAFTDEIEKRLPNPRSQGSLTP